MPRNLVAGPAAEPINLIEAKAHLRVDGSDEDALITALIGAAREQVEAITRQSLLLQTWDLTLDRFPCEIQLPGPVRSVSSITYVDPDGITQTLAASDYTVDTKSAVGRVTPSYSLSWPSTRDHINSVTMRYKAGFAVPFTAVAATNVLTAVGHTYANGDAVQLTNSGGALPAGLAVNTDCYVIGASGDALQLSATSGGASIDITGTGTGTHYIGAVPVSIRQAMLLMIGHWYGRREVVSDFQTYEVPYACDMLLSPFRVVRF
jgi:uncharacterized phiE125 gp8 family phage protein